MKVLDLFSGIGGFSLGLERAGMETVAFCEFDKHAQKVLKKHWPDVTIYEDVRTLDGKQFRGTIDVVCGGFPCQDISVAGNQAGIEEGTRSGLWSECARLLGEIRPRYAIFENVTALLNGGGGDWFKRVLWDISEVGYDAEWHCIPASELGAHHHRDRIWIIAYPKRNTSRTNARAQSRASNEWEKLQQKNREALPGNTGSICKDVADTNLLGCERHSEAGNPEEVRPRISELIKRLINDKQSEGWEVEPCVGRVANGVPRRSHRLKQLGNAVVPQIPDAIGRAIMEASKNG